MTNAEITAVILSVLPCFAAALIAGRFLIPRLRALKAGQTIREIGPKWHSSKAGTPAMGGLIFIFTALVGTVGAGIAFGTWISLLVLAFALVFGVIGFTDDYIKIKKKRNLGLNAPQKLVLQLAASAIYLLVLYHSGDLSCELWIPFTSIRWSIHPAIYLAFAIFVVVGTVNAVNLTDGIDGLATGVTMPVLIFFIVTAIGLKKAELAILPAALLGGLGGFLCYNFHPAKVFMGDTGSLFLGGIVSGLAFALDMPLILILVGLVYIIETISVILQVGYFKLTHGKRIFKMTPIHHHFEMCGWSEVKIWIVFVCVSLLTCAVAYFAVRALF